MSYEVKWTQKSNRILNKLPKETALRIWNKTQELKENPFRYLEHYEGDNCYKFRVGDYRLLIDVNFENKILMVRILDKRSRIYKR